MQGQTMVTVLAALWGAAEATLFFIVPDVLLSAVGLRYGLRTGWAAALGAAAGAVIGGVAVVFALRAGAPVAAAVEAVPAIGPRMIASARAAYADEGLVAVVRGAWTGVPYKIYAMLAAEAGTPVAIFAAVSFVARLSRFALAAAIGAGGRWAARRLRVPHGVVWALFAAFWLVFYALYFRWAAADPAAFVIGAV